MTPCNNSAHKTGEASPANQPLTRGLPAVTIGGVPATVLRNDTGRHSDGFRCTGGGDDGIAWYYG
jgi:hypothetical protein